MTLQPRKKFWIFGKFGTDILNYSGNNSNRKWCWEIREILRCDLRLESHEMNLFLRLMLSCGHTVLSLSEFLNGRFICCSSRDVNMLLSVNCLKNVAPFSLNVCRNIWFWIKTIPISSWITPRIIFSSTEEKYWFFYISEDATITVWLSLKVSGHVETGVW